MTQTIGQLPHKRIHPLIRDHSREHGFSYESCLDIGCGRGHYERWFERFEHASGNRAYVGVDADPEILTELQEDGIDARPSVDALGDYAGDLTLCLEVIEHLTPEETPPFLEAVARHTNKVVALTTPNFEYWRGSAFRSLPELRECRWIPDHAPTFRPSGGPHHHKQAMTPANLAQYFSAAFPRDEWEFEVYRAWPWKLEDLATGNAFELYFKLFGLVWRKL